jgi:CheY-like chemotaxis protein
MPPRPASKAPASAWPCPANLCTAWMAPWASPAPPGTGSTFWIELPTVQPTGRAPEAVAAITTRAYSSPKRVLYVEDLAHNVRLVEQFLAYRPTVTLISAMLAGIGLDLARQHHPDLVLADMHLPDMDGDELMLRLRADPATADIPVVMLSADATTRQIDRSSPQAPPPTSPNPSSSASFSPPSTTFLRTSGPPTRNGCRSQPAGPPVGRRGSCCGDSTRRPPGNHDRSQLG